VNNVDRLSRKFESIRKAVPEPEVKYVNGARIGILFCGTSREAALESQDQLKREYGIEASTFRVRAYPYTEVLEEFIGRHERVYVVDQNRDGQLYQLMQLDFEPAQVAKLRSLRYYNGLPIDARSITDDIRRKEAE
jgi:2-oxoglutarate/2-oxoacid ferredoxin oxidoreductase subunit alpha